MNASKQLLSASRSSSFSSMSQLLVSAAAFSPWARIRRTASIIRGRSTT